MFARPRPCMAAVHSSPLLGILKKTRRRRVWGLSPARLPRPLPCPPPRGFPLAAFLISVISVHKLLVITHTCQSLCRGTPERCSLEVCLTPPIDSHSPARGVLQGPCACVCVCTPARGVLQGPCACVRVCVHSCPGSAPRAVCVCVCVHSCLGSAPRAVCVRACVCVCTPARGVLQGPCACV